MNEAESGRSMLSIAVVLPALWHENDRIKNSVNVGLYIKAIESLGYEARLFCLPGSEFSSPTTQTASLDDLRSVRFWQQQNVAVVISCNSLHEPEINEAAATGSKVVIRADTDGMVSPRLFRKHWAQRLVWTQPGLRRFRAAWHWTRLAFGRDLSPDLAVVRSVAAAHATFVETSVAATNLSLVLGHYRRPDLGLRIKVFAHCIDPLFETADVIRRRTGVVSIGRWDSYQKNAPLLGAAIEHYLRRHPHECFTLVGPGSARFGRRLTQYKNVRVTGPVPNSEVVELLKTSRMIFSSSRWEGAAIVNFEALALGNTVVGTDIPCVRSLAMIGHGRMGTRARAKSLSEALELESNAWENGERDPEQIAHYWRERTSAAVFIAEVLAALDDCGSSERPQPHDLGGSNR